MIILARSINTCFPWFAWLIVAKYHVFLTRCAITTWKSPCMHYITPLQLQRSKFPKIISWKKFTRSRNTRNSTIQRDIITGKSFKKHKILNFFQTSHIGAFYDANRLCILNFSISLKNKLYSASYVTRCENTVLFHYVPTTEFSSNFYHYCIPTWWLHSPFQNFKIHILNFSLR